MSSEQLAGIIRHILTTLGGGLATKGLIDEAALSAIAGGIAALVGVAWSWWSKKKTA